MAEKKIKASVSQKKIDTVKKLVELIKNNNTLIITSIKNIPSRQFQNIRKTLRDKADVLVVKKRIMLKAIEDSGNKNIQPIKEKVCEDSAILFSKEDAFELASILANNKKPIGAKPGQTATEDISVEEGGTDIMPGPAISEFGALGIPIAVEDGKIAIKKSKVIVKAGEEINEAAASIMGKLEIKPFNIGLEPIALCDIQTGKIYLDVKIDKEKATKDLQTGAGKALAFSQTIAYYCKETIRYLLAKANSQATTISKLTPTEKTEEPKEEKAENNHDKKEEPKDDAQLTEENKSESKSEEN